MLIFLQLNKNHLVDLIERFSVKEKNKLTIAFSMVKEGFFIMFFFFNLRNYIIKQLLTIVDITSCPMPQ